MLQLLKKADELFDKINKAIIMFTGVLMASLIMVGAFMRYVFKIDFLGSEEIIMLAGFWMFFIGSISAAREQSHLNANMISVFTSNEKAIAITAFIKDILSLIICGLAVVWCYQYWAWAYALQPKTIIFKFPVYLQQFPMCISFLFWFLYLIRDSINSFVAIRKINKV